MNDDMKGRGKWNGVPLQGADQLAPPDNPLHAVDRWHRQPKPKCRSFQSSFSNKSVVFFGRQHPLLAVSEGESGSRIRWLCSQMLSLYLNIVGSMASLSFSHFWNILGETNPSKSIVLIINPKVGLTEVTSSFIIRFTIVVFPALSNPLEPIGSAQL